MIRFHVGDKVYWDGCPNEFRNSRYGTILKIHKNIAIIDDYRNSKNIRQVPLKILKKNKIIFGFYKKYLYICIRN